ncbi:MAG: CpcT/CpeT family chromophore lyase, partial [Luminiphilus sp.]
MNRLLFVVLWVFMTGVRADEAAVLDKDFRTMMQWFPGVYDNQEQVYFEAEQEVDEALRHERIHHVFEPVELPAFGEHVFYVQQHLNDDPAQIYRQRIYTFQPD